MLIETGFKANDVVTIKLTSGEELMARFVEETDTHYKLSKPLVIGMSNNGPALMPYLFTVNPGKDVKLHKPVTLIELSDDEFAKQYMQSTTNISLI
jgi:hypothetical protein